jgi:hypothetical protein
MAEPVLTDRQKKWFASVEANLEQKTGKPLAQWLKIMEGCPETRPRARMAWLKATHGVGQNHAAYILDGLKPAEAMGWDEPETLRAALWKEAGSEAILRAVERIAGDLDGVISGQRKGYTSFSRSVQFAAIRPLKGGKALLGLKLDPAVSDRLTAPGRSESWSERLVSVVELDGPGAVGGEVARLFGLAAENG